MRHEYLDLDNLVSTFGSVPFPAVYSGLTPNFVNGEFVFSAFEREDSRHWLALKARSLLAIMGRARTPRSTMELLEDFSRMDRQEQYFAAYNLSHEWKIATLAAAIAVVNQNCNVFEMGSCFGISSIHYSHLIKGKGVDPAMPVSRLITIERNREFVGIAKDLRKRCGEYAGEIKYVSGDGIRYLRKSLRNGDLVFASVASELVVMGVLDLCRERSFNFVISYSKSNHDAVRTIRGEHIEDIIDPSRYEIFPFRDREYNTNLTGDLPRMGILALTTK